MKNLLNILALLKVMGNEDIHHEEDSVTDWDWVFQDEEEEDKLQIISNIPIIKIYNQTYNC